ncbi:MAG: primosomal protein N' [Synechococcales cyanobacterium C42_A2020_086]|jgi:primosomal protein N' (replication factor Y)|nr:primosomal protein N' [Synechococcales cyanobacterium C42_A2020_086]
MDTSVIAPALPQFAAESSALYSSSARSSPQWVEVLVDGPGVQGLYTYSLPNDLIVEPGDILSVPFGAHQVGAIAIQLLQQPPTEVDATALRPVGEIISRGFFPAAYWGLLQRVADYYATPLMQVIRVALPPGLLGRSQRRIRLRAAAALPPPIHPAAQRLLQLLQSQKQGDYSWRYLQQQVRGAQHGLRELLHQGWAESYLDAPTPVRPKQRQAVTLTTQSPDLELSPRQREIVDVLKRRGGEMWLQDLLQTCHVSSSVLRTLEQKGYLVVQPREVLRLEQTLASPDQPKLLTTAQAAALDAITALQGYRSVLLHGVTGSGKTEIYLQAIAPCLQRHQSALVLVPEIGLTPQITDRFRARFGERVRVYHSALSEGERYDTWRQMLSGTPQVVIGTRSAVFAPLPNLGLIILDEEHDNSFKQDQPAPCYHARTVAQWRAEQNHCPLILGSATPSLETWLAAHKQQAASASVASHDSQPSPPLYLSLPERIQARPLPPIQVIDMRQEFHQGNRSVFSRPLQTALADLRQRQQQALLFIHRRGYSTFVSCRSCGYVMECPHCDVSLTYHQPREGGHQTLRCHYCGFGQSYPQSCPACGSPYLKHFGSGTQRIMQELTARFPELRCLRFDSDTTRTKGSHRAILQQFAQGEADVLVGTQMLTKGIDLPQVTLVGIVAADGLLHLADYRASERAFQTLTQVAGRAGRGEEPGQVLLQTYSPQHPVIQAVTEQNYPAFVETELQHRAALNYPPYGKLVLIRFSSLDAALVQRTANQVASQLQAWISREHLAWELLGPTPATIVRVAQRYRWQVLLKGNLSAAPPLLSDLRAICPAGVSLTLDVDPLNLL